MSQLDAEFYGFKCETSKEFDRHKSEISRLRADDGKNAEAVPYTHVAMRPTRKGREGSAAIGAVCVEKSRILRISEFDSTREATLLAELCVVV